MTKPKIYTDEETKENQKKSCVKYIMKRYNNDPEFKKLLQDRARNTYRLRKEREYFEQNGSLDGFVMKKYKNLD